MADRDEFKNEDAKRYLDDHSDLLWTDEEVKIVAEHMVSQAKYDTAVQVLGLIERIDNPDDEKDGLVACNELSSVFNIQPDDPITINQLVSRARTWAINAARATQQEIDKEAQIAEIAGDWRHQEMLADKEDEYADYLVSAPLEPFENHMGEQEIPEEQKWSEGTSAFMMRHNDGTVTWRKMTPEEIEAGGVPLEEDPAQAAQQQALWDAAVVEHETWRATATPAEIEEAERANDADTFALYME